MTQLTHERTAVAVSSQFTQSPSSRPGDHKRLFRLLEEVGPAPAEFMLHVSDPVMERENIFDDEDES